MTYLYLGSPYTHLEPGIMQERHDKACKVLVDLVRLGYTTYSPIVHFHHAALVHDLPPEAVFWEKHNMNMLASAKAFLVLQLPGWRESKGLGVELSYCRRVSKPIRHITPGNYFALRNI